MKGRKTLNTKHSLTNREQINLGNQKASRLSGIILKSENGSAM